MAKTGLQNEGVISELLVSGSQVINTKNDFGVYMFEEKETSDGVVFGKLQKPKYNEVEVEKSIDTKIIELLPTEVPQLPETVLKFIYDAKVAEVADLTEEIQQLNTEILSLEGIVTNLEIELETMRIDMDNKDLLLAVAENNAQQATTKVESSIQELQNAIQRATAESIQRVSAYARNESLKGQVMQYEEQLATSTKQINSLNTAILQQNGTIQAKDSSIDALSRDNSTLQTNLIKSVNNKKKIICNMLYEQGFIPQHIWAADEAFGEMMLKENRHVAMGYLMWAQSVVYYFTKNSQYSKYLYVAVKPWSEHMAHIMGVLPNDNLIGKGLHFVGCQYSLLVYNVVKLKRKYKKKKLSLAWL
jgi:lambda repressor-like predicted transcriptional regulator